MGDPKTVISSSSVNPSRQRGRQGAHGQLCLRFTSNAWAYSQVPRKPTPILHRVTWEDMNCMHQACSGDTGPQTNDFLGHDLLAVLVVKLDIGFLKIIAGPL